MKIDKYVKDLYNKIESFSSSATNCNDGNDFYDGGFAVIVIKHIWNWMNAVKRYLGRETGGAYLAIGFIVITHNAINLRLIAWLCLRNDDYRNSQMCTVTVPNIDIAIKSIKRMKTLFEPKLHVTFDSKEKVLELNGCRIEARHL